jgi:hypothetical protein
LIDEISSVGGTPTKHPPAEATLNGHQEQRIANGLPMDEDKKENSSHRDTNKISSDGEDEPTCAEQSLGVDSADAKSSGSGGDEKEKSSPEDEEGGRGQGMNGLEDTAKEEASNGVRTEEEESKVDHINLLGRFIRIC